MNAMKALSVEIANLERAVLLPIGHIVREAYEMVLKTDGRLREDGLISLEEIRLVKDFVFCIGYALIALQNGHPPVEAFEPFDAQFVEECERNDENPFSSE